jgi:hypothetical protein
VCTEPLAEATRVRESAERPDEEDRVPHLGENELAAFLDGRLTRRQRRRVEAHIDICDACRGELVEIGRATARRGVPSRVATAALSRRWWIPAVAAAGVIGVMLVPRLTSRPLATDVQSSAPRVADGEGQRRIALIAPADDITVHVAPIVFVWHAVEADVYRLSLLSENGEPIWAKETTDTTAMLPVTVTLNPGRAYFWRVDAVANGIVATTPARRVQVSPR